MRKKTISLILIIVLMLIGIGNVQAANTTATLRTSSSTVKPGDTFTVILSATCDGGIALVSGDEENDGFKFIYDNNKLELINKEAKRLIDLNEEATSDTVCLMGSSTSFSSGDVYELTFKVKQNVTSGSTEVSTTDMKITNFDDVETRVKPEKAIINIKVDSTDPSQQDNPTDPSQQDNPTDQSQQDNPVDQSKSQNQDDNTKKEIKSVSGSTTGTSTSGKSTGSTTAKSILPAAGSNTIKVIVFISICIFAAVSYKKVKQLKEIK